MNAVKQPYRLLKKHRKVMLREDLMALTQDIGQALVLSQMLYWTDRIDDFNELILEENKRLAEHGQKQIEYLHGWIWKSARQMKEELFNAISEDAIQRAFASLSEKGIFLKRRNPKFRYDRTMQYRVDLLVLRKMLKQIGIEFTDFQLETIPHSAESMPQPAESLPLCAETIPEITIESKIESNPLTPLTGGTESSPMGSHSGKVVDELRSTVNSDKEVNADAIDSRPPNSVSTRTPFRAPKSPPTKPADISDETWAAWCDLRKAKRAAVTAPVLAMLRKEADKAGWSLNSAMEECVLRNWQGFKADWLQRVHKQESQTSLL
jgi:hypothetical protein